MLMCWYSCLLDDLKTCREGISNRIREKADEDTQQHKRTMQLLHDMKLSKENSAV